MKILFSIFLIVASISLCGQNSSPQKLNFYLLSVLNDMDGEEELNVALHGDRNALIEFALTKRTKFYPIENGLILKLNKAEILSLNELEFVHHIEFDIGKGQTLNDQMLINNNVLPIHQGISPLNSNYTGEGVIVGIIDSGIELLHPDFLDENNQTRVLFLWDHLVDNDSTLIPADYGYGNVWTKEDIDNGVSTHVDQIQYFGHGSVVSGVATGDGSAAGSYMGVAPNAELIVVNSDFGREDWAGSITDAVDFIFTKASELGRPCVINASLGSYLGSHDGLDANALAIGQLIEEQPGRAFVCAAGNSGNIEPYHLKYIVDTDTNFTWFTYNSNSLLGYGSVFFELWADTSDFKNVQFAIGADKVFPNFNNRGTSSFRNVQDNIDVVVTDEITNNNGDVLAQVDSWATIRGGQYQVQIHLQEPDSSQYNFRFITTGSGMFDVWSTSAFGTSDMILGTAIPESAEFSDIENYKIPDGKQRIVTSWACSDKTLTVGNYVNRSEYEDYNNNIVDTGFEIGEISPTSSQGPSRDGKIKPDVAATGAFTLSSGSFQMLSWLINNEPFKVAPGGFHNRNGGTSMASPVVAGTAALFFEQCPFANYEFVLDAIQDNAVSDSDTGPVPSDLWGNGKIDALGSLLSYSVDGSIEIQEDNLLAEGGASYQWYFNGEILTDETNDLISPIETGIYSVEIINENGCIGNEEIFYTFTSAEDLYMLDINIYPNPTEGLLYLNGDMNHLTFELFDNKGSRVEVDRSSKTQDQIVLDLSRLPKGMYDLSWRSQKQRGSSPILIH